MDQISVSKRSRDLIQQHSLVVQFAILETTEQSSIDLNGTRVAFQSRLGVDQLLMHLLTLVELLENEVGSNDSARANLAALLAERDSSDGTKGRAANGQRQSRTGRGLAKARR